MSIPVLDLQNLSHKDLDAACRQWGFFALNGHDITTDLRKASLREIAKFFNQGLEEKNKIRRSASNCWGFYDAELTKNQQDQKEILDIGEAEHHGPLAGASPQWPADPNFVEVISELKQQLHNTSLQVTKEIVSTLGANLDVEETFTHHSSFLRLNFYPVSLSPPNKQNLGIHHHTDAGAVTALMQDHKAGLEVFNNNAWHEVPAQSDALIINIGDIVQVWSNDRYKAPLHRVRASTCDARISTPYFLNPDYNHNYQPLMSEPPRYRPINWGEFRAGRSAGDYADVGEEIQISQFKI